VNAAREVHVERLLGRRVRDVDGVVVGRVEELCVEFVDGEPAVTEFHLGGAALLERMRGFIRQLPFFSQLPWTRTLYRVPWRDMDLADEHHPRVRRRKSELPAVTR
jgi:sporulation protein YlmC with PRC-barrel domain